MAARNRPDLAPLPVGRRIGFVLVTVVAFTLDVMTVIPDFSAASQSPRWTVFGSWQTTVVQFTLIMGLVYAVLLLRRRAPVVALVWISAVSLTFTVAEDQNLPMAGVLVCLYTAASLLDRDWQAWAALVFTIVVQWAGLVLLPEPSGRDLWLGTLVLGGISAGLWLFGRRDYQATTAAAGLPDQLAEHRLQAAAEERSRIARELHDILAHSVSAMMMQAAGAKAMTTALRQDISDDLRLETVERALATIENTGSQSMRELHRLLSVLRGDGSGGGGTEGETSASIGMADVPALVELTRQSGLVVDVHTAGPPVKLDPSVGLAAYRVVQESLTNAMKHGGRGAMVDVFQNWQPDGLQLQVRCRSGHAGTAPGSSGGGNGLYGLRERVELVGGSFEAGWAGDEYVVTAVLPLTPTVPPAGFRPGAGGSVVGRPAAELHGQHGARLDGSRAGATQVGKGVVGVRTDRTGPGSGQAT